LGCDDLMVAHRRCMRRDPFGAERVATERDPGPGPRDLLTGTVPGHRMAAALPADVGAEGHIALLVIRIRNRVERPRTGCIPA